MRHTILDDGLKQRVVGAVVLVGAAVIVLPNVLDRPVGEPPLDPVQIPDRPAMLKINTLVNTSDNAKRNVMERINLDRLAIVAEPTETEVSTTGDQSERKREASAIATTGVNKVRKRHLQGAWTIQLASFEKTQNAQVLVDKLRGQGYNAYADRVDSGRVDSDKVDSDKLNSDRLNGVDDQASNITRVYVGPEVKKQRAEMLKDQLEQQLKLKDIMIIRFVP